EQATRHAEFRHDRRCDVTHRLHVETVHDEADHRQYEDLHLQRTDPAVTEQLPDVDRAGRLARLVHLRLPVEGGISDFAKPDPRSILAWRPVTAVGSEVSTADRVSDSGRGRR